MVDSDEADSGVSRRPILRTATTSTAGLTLTGPTGGKEFVPDASAPTREPTGGFEILFSASAEFRGNVTMDVEIIDEDENPMLHRTDVRFQLIHEEATPSRLSVRDSLAAKLNKDAGEVVVHELDTKYGMRKTVGYAKVYEDSEAAEDVEQEHMLERNKITADGEEDEGDADAEEA